MSRLPRVVAVAAALASGWLLTASGCKQGAGDRCEVDNDCSAGLVCYNPMGSNGICTEHPGATVPDASTDVSAPVLPDAAPDAPADSAADTAEDTAEDGKPDGKEDGGSDALEDGPRG